MNIDAGQKRLSKEAGVSFDVPDGGDQDDVEAQQVHLHPHHQGAQARCKPGVEHPEHNERGGSILNCFESQKLIVQILGELCDHSINGV